MGKFTWKNIMKSNAYVLTQGEYGTEAYANSEDYSLLNEYLIDNKRTSDSQKKNNKAVILKFFYDNVEEWNKKLDIKILNVSHLGYHMYMIEMACHRFRESGNIITLGFVHKDDLKAYLARRNS